MIIELLASLGFITSLAALSFSLKKNIEFMEKIEEVASSIQEAIDVLEEQYQIIDKKSKIELFSDEPLVKELVNDISVAKNAIMKTAKILDGVLVDDDLEDEDEET